jgi:hypothetical protein
MKKSRDFAKDIAMLKKCNILGFNQRVREIQTKKQTNKKRAKRNGWRAGPFRRGVQEKHES